MATSRVSGYCLQCARNLYRDKYPRSVFQSFSKYSILSPEFFSVPVRTLKADSFIGRPKNKPCLSYSSFQHESANTSSACGKILLRRLHSFSKIQEGFSYRGKLRFSSETVAVPQEDISYIDIQTENHIQSHLTNLCENIKKELRTKAKNLEEVSQYYFDGQGKYFRPNVVLLMSRACNKQAGKQSAVTDKQETVAMISEMIHTASLLHDDVIDCATSRRGKPSVNVMFGDQDSIIAGDFVMSRASMALAKTGNEVVVELIATVIRDLVRGELLQLIPGPDSNLQERFDLYLRKTYQKTASLIAHTCKSVAVLSGASSDVQKCAYEYGKHLGLAFQLVDDVLDFVSSEEVMGKPAAADLKLGLATAPVLFAAQKFPELNDLISRRFTHPGDVERARLAVENSDGISKTYEMASNHCHEAVTQIRELCPSPEREALIKITNTVLNRKK